MKKSAAMLYSQLSSRKVLRRVPALTQGLLGAGPQLDEVCLHLLPSSYRPTPYSMCFLMPELGGCQGCLQGILHLGYACLYFPLSSLHLVVRRCVQKGLCH